MARKVLNGLFFEVSNLIFYKQRAHRDHREGKIETLQQVWGGNQVSVILEGSVVVNIYEITLINAIPISIAVLKAVELTN